MKLDQELAIWKSKLITDIKIPSESCNSLATEIENEIRNLDEASKRSILDATPIPLFNRIEELQAFQAMMVTFNRMQPRPELVRTQIITQNYIAFVYLKDTLFETLRKVVPVGSLTKKCCKFLLNNPVRAFRNSFAHGNWKYKDDFSGIEYWAHKGNPNNGPMVKWEVSQEDLGFWQGVSRAIAYVCYMSLQD